MTLLLLFQSGEAPPATPNTRKSMQHRSRGRAR
jgi:hypothetical protein